MQPIDLKALLIGRLENLDVRESIRLFHGRGQCYEGLEFLTIDLFWPVVHITLYQTPDDAFIWCLVNDILNLLIEESLHTSVGEQWQSNITSASTATDFFPIPPREETHVTPSEQAIFETIHLQFRAGKSSRTLRLGNPLPPVHHVREEGLRFKIDLQRNQNVGFFLDMKPVRSWLRDNCDQKTVLNLFAYTCAFSVAALRGRAARVVNIDMSTSSMAWGQENHRLNEFDLRAAVFLRHEIFRTWGKIRQYGPYDIVIIDPPSFQPGSFVAEKDYHRITQKVAAVLSQEGVVIVALNSPRLGFEFIYDLLRTQLPDMEVDRVFDTPDYFSTSNSERERKVVLCRRKSVRVNSQENFVGARSAEL